LEAILGRINILSNRYLMSVGKKTVVSENPGVNLFFRGENPLSP
jgi:hypothetical protein